VLLLNDHLKIIKKSVKGNKKKKNLKNKWCVIFEKEISRHRGAPSESPSEL
jgi:hypothetical protein